MTARLDVTPKTTEQNRIVRTSKSEAAVTNNKKTALEVLYTIDATKLTTVLTDTKRRAASLRQQSYLFFETQCTWHSINKRSFTNEDNFLK